jgi:hypothetical protein
MCLSSCNYGYVYDQCYDINAPPEIAVHPASALQEESSFNKE